MENGLPEPQYYRYWLSTRTNDPARIWPWTRTRRTRDLFQGQRGSDHRDSAGEQVSSSLSAARRSHPNQHDLWVRSKDLRTCARMLRNTPYTCRLASHTASLRPAQFVGDHPAQGWTIQQGNFQSPQGVQQGPVSAARLPLCLPESQPLSTGT